MGEQFLYMVISPDYLVELGGTGIRELTRGLATLPQGASRNHGQEMDGRPQDSVVCLAVHCDVAKQMQPTQCNKGSGRTLASPASDSVVQQ